MERGWLFQSVDGRPGLFGGPGFFGGWCGFVRGANEAQV
jgi:hypothetical protein